MMYLLLLTGRVARVNLSNQHGMFASRDPFILHRTAGLHTYACSKQHVVSYKAQSAYRLSHLSEIPSDISLVMYTPPTALNLQTIALTGV
jgi:hypothetical protein